VPLAEFVDHETEVHTVDVDSLCQIAASGASDGSLALYDLKTKSHIRTLQPHHESIHSIQFTPDGTRIVSCASDHTVKVMELGGTEIFSVDIRETMKYVLLPKN
jgi:WD40 repeat protein